MAAHEELKASLLELTQPVFDQAGVDLIELNIRRQGREFVIEILADRPTGGISLEECSFLNRKVVDLIDSESAVPQEYSLDLSSPGLDRPLKTRKDFLRVIHKDIRFHLTGPIGGKLEYSGILKDVKENAVIIETQKHGEITIPIANISKAMQVF